MPKNFKDDYQKAFDFLVLEPLEDKVIEKNLEIEKRSKNAYN